MNVEAEFNKIPFLQFLGIEITDATNGRAEGRLKLREELSLEPDRLLAHGGVPFALADTVGAAAAASSMGQTTPTVDMRIDYLEPVMSDLQASGQVVNTGSTICRVRVELFSDEEHLVADAVGTYRVVNDE